MEIKTITCHNVYNCGASLQAYALMYYLKTLGHEVVIINYIPDYLVHYKLTGVANKKYDKFIIRDLYNAIKFPSRFISRLSKRKKLFDNFTNKYLNVTEKRYTSNDDLKNVIPFADIYITGSDQIWNTYFKNGRDPAFYLDFAPDDSIKASYAASLASNNIQEEWEQFVKEKVEQLDYVSVRESTGKNILNLLGIKDVEQVLDPVFLLNKSEWITLERESTITSLNEDYIFVYDFDRNDEIVQFSKRIAQEFNWKIFSYYKNNWSDKCFENSGPIEFISLIKNSKCVISNSFHGTAFAIIFEVDFYVFNRKENLNTRMVDLLSLLYLQDRMINSPNNEYTSIDYSKLNENLNRKIEQSKDFISRILGAKHDK